MSKKINGLNICRIKVVNYDIYAPDGSNLNGREVDAVILEGGDNAVVPMGNTSLWVMGPNYLIVEKSKEDILSGANSLCAAIGAVPQNLTINF